MIDIMIYNRTMNGIAKQFKTNKSTRQDIRKMNFTLLSCQVKFLNFKANIFNSLTSKPAITSDVRLMK